MVLSSKKKCVKVQFFSDEGLMSMKRRLCSALLTLPWLWLGLCGPATAQSFPTRPVRIIVPFPPGGATDVVARTLGARLSQLWKHPVVIENKPGGGGNIGADAVAKAEGDGYTLLLASPAEITINPHLYAKLPFDPVKDFVPVMRVASAPLVLTVNSKSVFKRPQDLVKQSVADARGLSYASSGTGGPQHLAGELFRVITQGNFVHIPYKGGSPAIADLLGEQVDFFFAVVPPALPHLNSGRLRAIAVTTETRSQLLPSVPTLSESGYPGFQIENWQGLFAPRATPQRIVDQIAADSRTVMADNTFRETLNASGASPAVLMPKEFDAFVKSESSKFSRLVKESGAKAD